MSRASSCVAFNVVVVVAVVVVVHEHNVLHCSRISAPTIADVQSDVPKSAQPSGSGWHPCVVVVAVDVTVVEDAVEVKIDEKQVHLFDGWKTYES